MPRKIGNHQILILKRYSKLRFNRTKKTKTKIKPNANINRFEHPILILMNRSPKKIPKLDKTVQGIKNKNLSKTKLWAANKIETQPTKIQATKKFDTSDRNFNRARKPIIEKKIKSTLE